MNQSEISPFTFLLVTLLGIAIAVSIMRSFASIDFMILAIIGAVLIAIALFITWRFYDKEPEDLMEDDL